MGFLQSVPVDEIRARGSIKDGDVARLMTALREEPQLCEAEADALLALHAACPIKEASWAPFLIETITEYLVFQAKPEGYLVAAKARWLAERIAYDGGIASTTELELLLNIIETARWSPPSLVQLALGQVKRAVATGEGPLRSSGPAASGHITQSDIDLLRRILLAYGRNGLAAVTRSEADILVDINRSLVTEGRTFEWNRFFATTVGNALLAGLGYAVAPRSETLGHGAWLTDMHARLAGAIGRDDAEDAQSGRLTASGAARVWSTARLRTSEERALARLERQRLEIITNETIDDVEESWLVAGLGCNHRFDAGETALLAYIKRETTALPATIDALAMRAAVAA